MDNIGIGDIVYTFVGEKLCRFEVTDLPDDIRLHGENDQESYCMYIDCCYKSAKEAIEGMYKRLEIIK